MPNALRPLLSELSKPLDRVGAYGLVPKGLRENLRWRRQLLRKAAGSKQLRADLKLLCAKDLLFYVNGFVWTYDPRKKARVLPMVTWPFQDRTLLDMQRAIVDGHDALVEKSRDMGASWMCILTFEHRWHFEYYESFLMVSRTEALVDESSQKKNPKALFWKVDFIHENLPFWLLPSGRELGADDPNRTKLHLYNADTHSVIDGEATTGDVGKGDRRTAVLLDEFAMVGAGHSVLAATRDVTRCRLFNSTPNGANNAFYQMRQNPSTHVITLHWSTHPEKAAGLYVDERGKFRSPWYDGECKRVANLVEIAQELDIDYLGSDYQFYGGDLIEEHRREYARPPYVEGQLDWNETTQRPVGFIEGEGPWRLWFNPDAEGKPPADREYVVGVDCGAGTGASNSCIVVGDRKTGEKVAEYAVSARPGAPEVMAPLVVAVARWFNGAYVKWEANGPGRNLGQRILELGYLRIYFRRDEASVSRKMRDVPGWWSTKDSKRALLGAHRRAMTAGEFIDRSTVSLDECLQYVHLASGAIEHAGSVHTIDPTGAGHNHGDLVIASALCHSAMKDLGGIKPAHEDPSHDPPEGSMAYRRKRRQEARKRDRFW